MKNTGFECDPRKGVKFVSTVETMIPSEIMLCPEQHQNYEKGLKMNEMQKRIKTVVL